MSRRLTTGDVIGGDFEIVRVLGEGGMGTVFEAKQRSTGARRAIKTMLPELANGDEFRERFAQEAQVVTKVESEHVVQVLSAGIDAEHGVPWIAMELLEGEDLAARLTRTAPLDVDVAREVFAQIGHAFTAAHAAGVVHRDLKPENVFVCAARSVTRSMNVKVLDFGIAKVLTSNITRATSSMGSPLWMAPEQTLTGGAISPATDVWAFGLMAFYALTGRLYWHAANGLGGSAITLMREITLDPIESASERSKALHGAAPPPGFDEWFARCLSREPSARFADAGVAVPPLLSLLAAAPKRTPRAIDLLATQGLPTSTASDAAAIPPTAIPPTAIPPTATPAAATPATADPQAKTDTAFANAGDAPQSPEALRPTRGVPPLALAAVALVGAVLAGRYFLAAKQTEEPTPAAASSPTASAAHPDDGLERARAVPMIDFGDDVFTIGNDKGLEDERPAVKTSVGGFAIDVHEVDVAAYLACVAANRCTPAGTEPQCNAPDKEKANHPINCVKYADAKAYCEWVDKRLPSEVEWERAARGKAERHFAWGSAKPDTQLCWQREDGPVHGTCAIGSFPAGNTPEGLQDMSGNVWEWTTTRYCNYDTSNCTDERRVARGGSWASTNPQSVTTTVRNETFETARGASMGFRCVRSR